MLITVGRYKHCGQVEILPFTHLGVFNEPNFQEPKDNQAVPVLTYQFNNERFTRPLVLPVFWRRRDGDKIQGEK